VDSARARRSPPARGRPFADAETSTGAGDPRDRKTLEQPLQILEAQAATGAPFVPVVMGGRAVRPLLGVHGELLAERRDLMVWTYAHEVDAVGHHWIERIAQVGQSPEQVDIERLRRGSPDRRRRAIRRPAGLPPMNDDRLLDFVCIRETHQSEPAAPLVSVDSGALMLCPSGETVGHIWRAAAGAPFIDDRAAARGLATRGRVVRVPLRPN
jgi:hypothetical protein